VRVALVTWEGAPGVDADDVPLVGALAGRGHRALAAVWSDPAVDWSSFDLIVIRSAWDYHRRVVEFRKWIDRPEVANRLWNRSATVRWNSDKTYLRDLETRGVAIVPTVWTSAVTSVDEALRTRGWDRAVIKPSVSADGENTHLLDASNRGDHERLYSELRSRGEVLLQPFVEAVVNEGERSLVFLDGAYSHAALRPSRLVPAPNLRGGAPVVPSLAQIEVARHALGAVDEPTLYARVDLVTDGEGVPRLMELELIEPTLFLRSAPMAVERFAAAIDRRSSWPGKGSKSAPAATNP
jgi:glutathione synthase/RimK-type ligase-like ATP-grasp enzyme